MPKLIYHDSDGIDKSFNLAAEPVLIGRASECQIQTQDAMVSRRHARISWDGNYWVEDLGSSNGVYVGHEKVQRAPFRPGDVVTCGSLVLRMTPDTVRPATGPVQTPTGNTPPPGVRAPATAALPAQELGGAPPGWPAPRTGRTPPSGQLTPEMRSARTPPTGSVARTGRTPPTGAQAAQAYDSGDINSERRRREEAETALLAAAERVKIAEARAQENEAAAREGAILRRKLEQMTIDMRRLREGAGSNPDDAGRAAAENERDRWRQRAAELEQQLAQAQSMGGGGAGGDPAETDRLRRQVEQMTADLRRLRASGGGGGDQSSKVAELELALRRAEADRDTLRAQVGHGSSGGGGGLDPAAADAAIALGDALAELRSSLRAASDESTMLSAPTESVQVVTDALSQATSQLEGARASLRALGKILGVA